MTPRLVLAGLIISWSNSSVLAAGPGAIMPSAWTIAQGATDTFTVDVPPGTAVQFVTLTYEGESGQDVAAVAPYQFTHQFDQAMRNLTVTATITYTDPDRPPESMSVDINVVGLTLIGSAAPMRGWPAGYVAQSNPPGIVISQFNWSYDFAGGGSNTYADTAGTSDKSGWSGILVKDGTVRCSATVSGVAVQAAKTVTITPRSWTTPITCAQDNEPDWGDIPTLQAPLGQNRDRDSNIGGYFFVPRNPGSDFTPACTLSVVLSGPCAGWWYVSSSTLKCQRETVINKYIKETGPSVGPLTFWQANANCFSTTCADFLQAVKNHEYRGTPDTYKSPNGHHGRTEQSIIDFGHDAKQHIESLTNRFKANLAADINNTIGADEFEVGQDAEGGDHEEYFSTYGPNWGYGPNALGAGQHSLWDGSGWTDCVNGPEQF